MGIIIGIILIFLALFIIAILFGGTLIATGLAMIQAGGVFSLVFGVILFIIGVKIVLKAIF